MATTPVVIDEGGLDRWLGRVSWKDDEAEPWRSVTEYALKPLGELRTNLTAAIAAGRVKHKFYKLDHGKLSECPAIPRDQIKQVSEGNTMSKTAQAVSEGVAKLSKEEKAKMRATVKADKAKAKADKKAQAKEAKKAKKAAAKEQKGPGVIAAIREELAKANGHGINRKDLIAALDKRFPGRPHSRWMNTIGAYFRTLTIEKVLIVRKPADGGQKLYSLKKAASEEVKAEVKEQKKAAKASEKQTAPAAEPVGNPKANDSQGAHVDAQ